MKQWIIDKWWWLKTFNKPPQIVIDADILVFLTEGGKHAINSLGRIDIVINGDLITFSKEKQEWLLQQAKEMDKEQSLKKIIYDLDELASEYSEGKSTSEVFKRAHESDFKAGFQKAIELLTFKTTEQ